jgi:hypothetical protein
LDIGNGPVQSLSQLHLSLNPLLLHNDPKEGGTLILQRKLLRWLSQWSPVNYTGITMAYR